MIIKVVQAECKEIWGDDERRKSTSHPRPHRSHDHYHLGQFSCLLSVQSRIPAFLFFFFLRPFFMQHKQAPCYYSISESAAEWPSLRTQQPPINAHENQHWQGPLIQ